MVSHKCSYIFTHYDIYYISRAESTGPQIGFIDVGGRTCQLRHDLCRGEDLWVQY